jgi:hypothetical protein
MGMTKPRWTGSALGCCLLAVALLRAAGVPRAGQAAAPRTYPAFPMTLLRFHPHSRPFDGALREAIDWQQRAVDDARRNQEALQAWDPKADGGEGPSASENWKRQIARDSSGYLRRARAEAQRAAALARTPHERCRAGALLASLDCSLGDHKDELRQARRMVTLEPGSDLSLVCLQHAARCNGLKRLERQTTIALDTLRGSRDAGSAYERKVGGGGDDPLAAGLPGGGGPALPGRSTR